MTMVEHFHWYTGSELSPELELVMPDDPVAADR